MDRSVIPETIDAIDFCFEVEDVSSDIFLITSHGGINGASTQVVNLKLKRGISILNPIKVFDSKEEEEAIVEYLRIYVAPSGVKGEDTLEEGSIASQSDHRHIFIYHDIYANITNLISI